MKIKTEQQQKTEMLNCIIWAGICLMFLHVLTGCSGFKACASINSIDEVTDQQKLNKPVPKANE